MTASRANFSLELPAALFCWGRRRFSFQEQRRGPLSRSLLLLLLAILLIAQGCTASPESQSGLTVAAAANVKFAFEEIGPRFEAQTDIPVTFVFGSTGALAQQIENGAPYDVFAAADIVHIDQLAAQSLLLPGTARSYAQGRLALIVNRDSGVKAASLADLTDPGITRIAIANPEYAPYGQAALEALAAAGLQDELQGKLIWAGTVRQALQFVQTGDAPAGIVSLSIAEVPEVSYTLIPDDLHAPIEQQIAALARSKQPDAARRFVEFISGPDGQAILTRYGYRTPADF